MNFRTYNLFNVENVIEDESSGDDEEASTAASEKKDEATEDKKTLDNNQIRARLSLIK